MATWGIGHGALDEGPRLWGRGTESRVERQEEIAAIVGLGCAVANLQFLKGWLFLSNWSNARILFPYWQKYN